MMKSLDPVNERRSMQRAPTALLSETMQANEGVYPKPKCRKKKDRKEACSCAMQLSLRRAAEEVDVGACCALRVGVANLEVVALLILWHLDERYAHKTLRKQTHVEP